MLKFAAASLAVLSLCACAGRPPSPPTLFLATDRELGCDQISAETKLNNGRMTELATEKQWKFGQNVVAGIAGFMAWPAWLALDLQDAAGREAHALSQRNEYLLTLASERCETKGQIAQAPPEAPNLSPLASNAEITSALVSQ